LGAIGWLVALPLVAIIYTIWKPERTSDVLFTSPPTATRLGCLRSVAILLMLLLLAVLGGVIYFAVNPPARCSLMLAGRHARTDHPAQRVRRSGVLRVPCLCSVVPWSWVSERKREQIEISSWLGVVVFGLVMLQGAHRAIF
jgi:hypothetical protein